MEKLVIKNVKLDVNSHPSGKDYSLLTLYATVNGKPCKSSISVFSKFIFDCEDNNRREILLSDILTKLSHDLIISSYFNFDFTVKSTCDIKDILKQMEDLHLQN